MIRRRRAPQCKYVAKRSGKTAAKRLAADLRRDGFRARIKGAAGDYVVLSCGRLKRR